VQIRTVTKVAGSRNEASATVDLSQPIGIVAMSSAFTRADFQRAANQLDHYPGKTVQIKKHAKGAAREIRPINQRFDRDQDEPKLAPG